MAGRIATLNVGAIINLAPDVLSVYGGATGGLKRLSRTVLNSWGPGKFDAELCA
jgi:hypothetical protein